MTKPRTPPKRDLVYGEGVADPEYLVDEIEELQVIAERSGNTNLAYLLQLAANECRHQIRTKRERDAGPHGGRWKPIRR
jgi:hypothetical protein